MKILLISPVGNLINGGIGKWTGHIMSYYKEHGDGVELKLLSNPKARTNFETNTLLQRLVNGFRNYVPLVKSCKKTLRKERFDAVHICTSASLSLLKDLLIARAAHRRHIKTYIHCRFGRLPEVLQSKGLEHRLFNRLIRVAAGIIAIDMRSFKALRAYGCDKVFYLPNPLAPSVEQLVKENASLRREPGKIVFAGHVMSTKGVYELVEACRQLKGIKLTMLGYVPDEKVKAELYALAGEGHPTWLDITGALPIEDVIREMLSCSVFALPTYTEGFPNVIIESMACACPIVTTPVGAIPEMLAIDSDAPCGICVEPKNVDQLKDALEKLLADSELAATLGKRAQTRVSEQYAMEKIWGQLVAIWKGNNQNDPR